MRPPDLQKPALLAGLLLVMRANTETCPLETPTDSPSTDGSVSSLGPIKKLILKPKTCPDFKDDVDQNYCCPSRITFGSFYCCTIHQKHEIQSEIASERRRQFVKKYLVVIIISTITLSVLSIVAASIICKRVRCCPLHHSKGDYSRSNTSFQIPFSHSAVGGGSRYQPVSQARRSDTFNNVNSTPPQTNKLVSYEAPPPYESLVDQSSANTSTQMQHQYNRIMENQLNSMLQNENDQSAALSAVAHRSTNDFVVVPPPARLHQLETLHDID